jgi:BMFP domain-containing protein YqiC
MQTQNKLLDDLARVASGALGVAAGMREEVEARLRDQFARVLEHMDLVTREEFEAARAMAVKAREEQEVLEDRIAALERALAAKAKSPAGAKARKPATAKAKTRAKASTKAKTTASTKDAAGTGDG